VLSLATFWLAVRPPRIAIPLAPQDVGLAVEEVSVRADDGVTLAGWLAVRPGAPAIVLLHGYPAEKADMLPLAAALHRRFTVLLLDLRYFGRSGGRATTLGFRERGDLRRAVDLLESRGHGPVGVFGFSLGGAVAILAAAEDPRIRALVSYGAFADLRTLASELYAHFWVLRGPLVRLMRLWSRLFLGADVTRPAPAEAAARLTVPVLLVHSHEDEQIGIEHARRLHAALTANPAADLLVLETGRHGVLGADFERRVAEFFSRHLE